MSTVADAFCEIDLLAGEARRALDNGGERKTACGYLVAVQAKAQVGLQDSIANEPKLAAFDGLLAAMEKFTDEVETLHRTLGPHHCTAASCPDIDAAHAALASAKEQTAPDAEAPGAGTGSEVSTD